MLARLSTARQIHIVGMSGTEGTAVALYLTKLGLPYTGHDFSTKAKFKRSFAATHLGLSPSAREKTFTKLWSQRQQIHFQADYLKGIGKADLIVVSQNWEAYPPNRKLKAIYKRNPERFLTITQLYFALWPGQILAVTGTNGKSTTTKLISKIVQASRQKCYFTGNDRRNVQILNSLDKICVQDWLVIEVSNRQLKFPLDRAPDIGVITNVTRNHLDEYGGSFAKYKAGKYSLIAQQTKNQIAVLNQDDTATRSFVKRVKSTVLPYSVESKLRRGVYLSNKFIVHKDQLTTRVLPIEQIQVSGRHNLSNICAAIAATRAAGISWSVIRKAVAEFKGIPQRLERIAVKRGVAFINDTASTTPESAIAALEAFPAGSIHLIVGGDPKGMDYTPLARAIKQQEIRSLTLIQSPAAAALKKLVVEKSKLEISTVPDLKTAVSQSFERARKGEFVLLSPAAAYFCYFKGKIPLGGRGFDLFVQQLDKRNALKNSETSW